jgi:hypothetical protein
MRKKVGEGAWADRVQVARAWLEARLRGVSSLSSTALIALARKP